MLAHLFGSELKKKVNTCLNEIDEKNKETSELDSLVKQLKEQITTAEVLAHCRLNGDSLVEMTQVEMSVVAEELVRLGLASAGDLPVDGQSPALRVKLLSVLGNYSRLVGEEMLHQEFIQQAQETEKTLTNENDELKSRFKDLSSLVEKTMEIEDVADLPETSRTLQKGKKAVDEIQKLELLAADTQREFQK